MPKKKSDLQKQLEESIKLAKANGGRFPKKGWKDSLGNRLRHLDGEDMPDALADPEGLVGMDLSDIDARDEP